MSDDGQHVEGVSIVTWDNLGEGWRMRCLCGQFITIPCADLVDAAEDMTEHWEANRG